MGTSIREGRKSIHQKFLGQIRYLRWKNRIPYFLAKCLRNLCEVL
jgi:hypothetical protein